MPHKPLLGDARGLGQTNSPSSCMTFEVLNNCPSMIEKGFHASGLYTHAPQDPTPTLVTSCCCRLRGAATLVCCHLSCRW